MYGYGEKGEKRVRVQSSPVCPTPVTASAIGGILAAVLFLVGLAAILLYKLCTVWHDRREYARFEENKKNERWTAVSFQDLRACHSFDNSFSYSTTGNQSFVRASNYNY